MEFLSRTAVLAVPGLSFSRRRNRNVARVAASPREGKVDRSPVGLIPSSSNRDLVGNLEFEEYL